MRASPVRPLVVLVALVPLVVACGGSASKEQTENRITTGGTDTVTVREPPAVSAAARFAAAARAACVRARRNAPARAPRGTAGLVRYAERQARAARRAAAELARVKAPPSLAAVVVAARRDYARLLAAYARTVKAGATNDRAALRRARRSLERAERAASRAAVAAGVPACAPRAARR
jgi:hypothetical protein